MPAAVLLRCGQEDRTDLAGCVKAYLPAGQDDPRQQPLGIVFTLVIRERRAVLEFLAFGVRHHPRDAHAPTVYVLAHYRRHGAWPPR